MPKVDTSVPPPLRALGGWEDADWFAAGILTDDEVVGLTFPKLPGVRKQNFHLVERSAPVATKPVRGAAPAGGAAPGGGILSILDGLRVRRAAAFRKPTFFFDGPAVLFFADIPAAHLKIRAADVLRRDLIAASFRGCVVRHDGACVTAMFWPGAEADITTFVGAAGPPHRLHAQFDTQAGGRVPAGPAPRAQEAERADLLRELDALRRRISDLQQSQSAVGALQTLGLDEARLKSLLVLLHPDKHANSQAATEAASWVNGLRDLLKAAR